MAADPLDLLKRLRALDRDDDALELRIALARQSMKAAQAHAHGPHPHPERSSDLLDRAQAQLRRAS